MMKNLIQHGFRRSRKADRLAWILLVAFSLALLISVLAGFHGLGLVYWALGVAAKQGRDQPAQVSDVLQRFLYLQPDLILIVDPGAPCHLAKQEAVSQVQAD